MITRKLSYLCCGILMFLLISVFLSCSKNPTNDETDNTTPVILSVTPTHATPGVIVSVAGFTIDTTKTTSYTIFIGGQQSLLISDTSGAVSTIAPMFFTDSTDTWPTPPTGALDIEIYLDSTLVAVGRNLFTVDSLIKAPGATQELVDNTIATVESYKEILVALSTGPSIQEQLTVGLIAALDSLIYGQGDSSMTALLADLEVNNPDALELLDAIYGSSGSADQSQEIADAIAAIAASLNSGNLKSASIIPDDVRLAAMMQLSSMLKLYGDAYIHGITETVSNIGAITGWLGLVKDLLKPVTQLIGATAVYTSFVDLVFNKIVVATMPTTIDSLTITFTNDTLSTADTTISQLKVYTSNNPPQITAGDLVDQFLSIAGLIVSDNSFIKEKMHEGVEFLLGQMKNAMKAYADANPGIGFDPGLFDLVSVPIIKWEAEVTDSRLLDLHTTTPLLLTVEDSLLEWRSLGSEGAAHVTITPALDDDVVLIPVPPFLSYGGTAFGLLDSSSALVSETMELTIQGTLALELDFAPTISPNGGNVLGVRAGLIDTFGDTIWQEGLNVQLTTIGGGADPSSGITDATGQFASVITLNPFSDTVEVSVTVTSEFGSLAVAEVMATTTTGGTFTASVEGSIISISSDGQVIDTILTNPNITRGSSYYWSPDGTKIVIGSKYILGLDGSELQLANVGTTNWGTWSPDGKYLYKTDLIRTETLDSSVLRVIPTDGSAITDLYSTSNSDPNVSLRQFQQPAVSHDGKFIAILVDERPIASIGRPNGINGLNILRLINTTTGATTDLTTIIWPYERLAYHTVTVKGAGPAGSVMWSPDDSKILIYYSWSDTSGVIESGVYSVEVSDGSMTKVAPFTDYVTGFLPNSTEILVERAYVSNPPEYELMITDIFTFSIQTTLQKTFYYTSSTAISGDGSKIAVLTVNNSLKIFNKDGSVSGILSNQPFISSVRWKP